LEDKVQKDVLDFRRGDHICAVYSAMPELARTVADFLNQFYDRSMTGRGPLDHADPLGRLEQLDRAVGARRNSL